MQIVSFLYFCSGKIDVVGKTGVADDCFNDPAGTVVDDYGNFIIADSR